MSAQVSSRCTLTLAAHGRDTVRMTAGDLLRAELEKGASVLGLAKRIAGQKSDAHPEVQRWRFIIHRAAEGAEPNPKNARQISEVLAQKVEKPRARRVRPEGLEDVLAALRAGQVEASEDIDELRGLLVGIREMLDVRLPEQRARRGSA